jgi:hypothetical protein
MRVIGLVLALGVVLAPLAASAGSLLILAVDAVSGRLPPEATATYVYLGNEYWDVPLTSSRTAEYTLEPGDYQVSVVAPGYKETSVRVFLTASTARIPLIVKLEKATSSDPPERHRPK